MNVIFCLTTLFEIIMRLRSNIRRGRREAVLSFITKGSIGPALETWSSWPKEETSVYTITCGHIKDAKDGLVRQGIEVHATTILPCIITS